MELCDGCGCLQIEEPVNRYDVWRACCCDPDKPMPGERRTVATAPASWERGPIRIPRPKWCGENPPGAAAPAPFRQESQREKESRHGGDDTVTAGTDCDGPGGPRNDIQRETNNKSLCATL